MSDFLRAPTINAPNLLQPRGLTDYERQLQPIFQEELQQETSERKWMRPLQWIMDRLQTGQYISANIATAIIQSAQGVTPEARQTLLEAIRTGITGEVKGSYVDVLRDTLGVGTSKIFKNAREGSRIGQVDWADVLGFAADIILDPTTYMAFGGATKGASKAAGEFADDTVRLYLRQLAQNPEEIVRLTRGRIGQEAVEDALAKGTERGFKALIGKGDDLSRVIGRTYKEAYNQGLRETQDRLARATTERLRDIGEPEGGLAQWGLQDIATRLEGRAAYQRGGETFAARFMGKELGVGPERGLTQIRRNTWDRFANRFKQTKVGNTLADAVWGVMNNGPVGEIRRMFGFRDPYQKYVRAKELTQGRVLADVAANDALVDVFRPLKDFSDEEVRQVLHVMSQREAAVMAGETATERMVGRRLISTGDAKVDDAANKLQEVFQRWGSEEGFWAQRLREDPGNYREWYVPEKFRYRQEGASPRRRRERTYLESYDREKELTKLMYNVDDDMAKRMMEADITGLGTNFREALAERALVHGRARARYSLVEQIKEMGIDLRDTLDPAADALRTRGRDLTPLGMKTIDHPALEGFVFDYDVAEIAKRAIDVSGQQRNLFQRAMAKYAAWWKGMVTATTGFHARNFMSNTMTQFLKHGTRAFNKNEIMQSTAAVAYALRNVDPKRFLDNFDDSWMQKYLNQRVGNLTVRELADEARRLGVISEHTMGFGGMDIAEKVTGKGAKISAEQGPIRNVSRALGNYVENIPRFQSFLIDYADNATADITKITPDNLLTVERPALEYASREAKKWFLDYTDLTEFEQGTLKNIIPFYSWLRKNLGNQLSGIVLYPEMYSLIPKVEDLMTYEDPDYDPAMVPEWMREEGMFPIGKTEEGFRFFRPDFAYTDLNLIPLQWEEGDVLPHLNMSDLKDTVINATAPWLRDVASRMTTENGYNYFYREQLAETGDAPYLVRLMASRPGTIAFIDGLLKTVGYEDGAKLQLDDNGKLQMDAQMAQTLEDYLPVLRQAEFLFYLPQTVFPGLEDIIERTTLAQDDYEGAEQVMQMLSYYLGIKTKDVDLEREKQRIGYDIYYRSRDILDQIRQQQPGYEARSLQSRQRTADTIRRIGG